MSLATSQYFGPTNDAFASVLGQQNLTLEDLTTDRVLLQEILAYHVIPGALKAADFGEGGTFETAVGSASGCGVSSIEVVVDDDGTVTIVGGETEAKVVTADVEAGTTVIHVVDGVLLPCPIRARSSPILPTPPSAPKRKRSQLKEFFCFLFFNLFC